VGDPINAVRIYNDLRVDEIALLDIDASKENRSISIDLIKEIGEEANMPFSVGGGIRDTDTIKRIIQAGAERVILNTNALNDPQFIQESSDAFGASTIVVCVDYKKTFFGKNLVYTRGGSQKTTLGPLEAAILAESNGAGEVILQSIDKDGTMSGFDIETIEAVNTSLSIPVVALGGAGQISDFENLYRQTSINGIAAGSFFVFQGKHRGVLIRYPPISHYNFN
jgi:cyclase